MSVKEKAALKEKRQQTKKENALKSVSPAGEPVPQKMREGRGRINT
jgi:hypothetical protein